MGEVKKDIAVARVQVCLASFYYVWLSFFHSLHTFSSLQAKYKRDLVSVVNKQEIDRTGH
jgi:hypothetical protein